MKLDLNLVQIYNLDSTRSEMAAFQELPMLYTIALILLIGWLLALVTGLTIGGFVHVLLVVAIVLFLVQLLAGRSPGSGDYAS